MDVISHALWAGAASEALGRRYVITKGTLYGIVMLAVAPDIVPMLPLLTWGISSTGSVETIYSYITGTPATEPLLPAQLLLWIHHLHCTMHSAIVLAAITLAAWALTRHFPFMLVGWWSHVLIDIPTHSADYYKVAPLYPFVDVGIDGIAWIEPWFLIVNYCALALIYLLLWRAGGTHRQERPSSVTRRAL